VLQTFLILCCFKTGIVSLQIFNIFSPSLMQPSCSSLHSLNTLNYTTCFGL
jgi:hypothetical protein